MRVGALSVAIGRVTALLLLSLTLARCSPQDAVSPEPPPADAARGSASGPTVKATVPDTGFRNTTLQVRILGSGFDRGSRAVWALHGDTTFATTRIATTSTKYVKSTELVATISIGDAPIDRYDVQVLTAGGKKGIGIELFAVTYEIVDLGSLGGIHSRALGLNNLGQVVGWSHTASGAMHAFLWTEATGMQDLGTLGGANSEAHDINDTGEIVGVSASATMWRRAFRWTVAEGMQELTSAAGARSEAYAINAEGVIGGQSDEPVAAPLNPAIWTAGLVGPIDSVYAWVWAVNSAGQAVGAGDLGSGTRALYWERGASGWTRQEIAPNATNASDINASGQVTGNYYPETGGYKGFVWTRTGGLETLPPLAGGELTYGRAISDGGRVGGFSTISGGAVAAVFWSKAPDETWIPERLPDFTRGDAEVWDVNEGGDMVGFASALGGEGTRAVLWRMR